MNKATRLVGLILIVGLCGALALAQQSGIRINGASWNGQATPGQLVQVFVDGVRVRAMPPPPLDDFEVFVSQDGVTRPARVREVGVVVLPKPADESPSTSKKAPAGAPAAAESDDLLQRTLLTFTVPVDLHVGDATATLAYRGQRSDAYAFKVNTQPPTPHVYLPFSTATMSSRPPTKAPDNPKERAAQASRLERGQPAVIFVTPLIDPEVTDAAVLVTFKQANYQREVLADIVTHEPVEVSGERSMRLSAKRYEVRVQTPADLGVGPAELEVRLRVNGVVGEAGRTSVQVTDMYAGNPSDSAPHINDFQPAKVGIGQAVHLFVHDPRRLQPEPEKVVVVLEQEGQRVELKPESNSALYSRGDEMPLVFLVVRLGKEITGKATLRVYHPSRGAAGLSDSVPIEIVNDVLAPEVTKVTEATKQDIAQLSAMREQWMRAGREFKEYDPKYRYVTIRANGLDHSPNYTRIVFQQGGRSYQLKFEDYSLFMGDRTVVRLPDQIKPGEVTVTIQNRGADRLSVPAIMTFEVTEPSHQ
jgi:hypothetical protein